MADKILGLTAYVLPFLVGKVEIAVLDTMEQVILAVRAGIA
jgi:hypothetical protein